jgi:Zn-dependent protease with chaperone function
MREVNLSFARYVADRKAAALRESEVAVAYSYGGDRRVRAALDSVGPVGAAMETALRLWHAVGKNEVLGSAVRIGEGQFPQLHALVRRCAETLGLPAPTVYVAAGKMRSKVRTLGSNDDPLILLGSSLVDNLSDTEMLFVLGRECGHIQNRHTTYLTCLHFLVETSSRFVRWVSHPATVALNGWSRRAAITADRAGLLCARDLDLAVALMVRSAVGSKKLFRQLDLAAYLAQLEEGQNVVGRFSELLAAAPDLPKRV